MKTAIGPAHLGHLEPEGAVYGTRDVKGARHHPADAIPDGGRHRLRADVPAAVLVREGQRGRSPRWRRLHPRSDVGIQLGAVVPDGFPGGSSR